jgi:hypothetical protein
MVNMQNLTAEQKEEFAAIRARRREAIKEAFQANREHLMAIKRIRARLDAAENPMTIPEIADSVGLPASQVLWCVTAMKKYGMISEGENDGGYFRYALELDAPDHEDEE